jgi:DNA-binding NarL/FixJ family response regulator
MADGSSLTVVGAELLLKNRADTAMLRAHNAHELIQLAQQMQPEVMLIGDQFDPLMDTLEVIERLLNAAPHSQIIVIGKLNDGMLIRDLFNMGAAGYLAAGDNLSECLLTAVDTVLRRRPYLSPTANAEYLILMHNGDKEWKLDAEARTVLRMLVQGRSIGSIAAEMRVARRHIYWVRHKLRRRFGAETNEHLITRAIAEGFGGMPDYR